MLLNKILGIKKGDIVSIVGSGGKTTLMYLLAKELSECAKVLTTTTTKIYLPTKKKVDFIAVGEENFNNVRNNSSYGIYSYGKYINEENKLIGIEKEKIKNYINNFDYIIIESDGSKRKPIKGWNDKEPVIYDETSITIGIISLESFEMIINDENVHRVDKFIELTKSSLGKKININHFTKVIFNGNGLFRGSKGGRILFLNKLEKINEENLNLLIDEISKINNECKLLNKIVVGSLKNRKYEVINKFINS